MWKLALLTVLVLLKRVNCQCVSNNDKQQVTAPLNLGSMSQFSLRLFKEIETPEADFIFSPYSIWTALILAYFGTKGSTKTQMEKVLHLRNRADTYALYKELRQMYTALQKDTDYTFDTANRMYFEKDLNLRTCLKTALAEEFRTIDFKNVVGATDSINKFVDDETEGKIHHLVSPASLSDVAAVIVNAAYFKGIWASRFNAKLTRKDMFYTAHHEYVMVDIMRQRNAFNYGMCDKLEAHILELPYRGNNVSMYVFLPFTKNTGTELDEMIERLDEDSYNCALRNLRTTNINVKIPKFRLETSVHKNLKDALIRMGMNEVFSDKANLSKLGWPLGAKVSKVVHKALVEITEEGARPWSGGLHNQSSSSQREEFVCNRPFLFVIRDKNIESILFIGSYRHKQSNLTDSFED